MSVAASLAGLHPLTLRHYERRGLVEPFRTDGGNRRYNDADLDLPRRNVTLRGKGVNLEGIRRTLELESKVAPLTNALDRARRADRRERGSASTK